MVAADAITATLAELERARQNVKRGANRQIRNADERAGLRALAFAWFRAHRKAAALNADQASLAAVDTTYQTILDATEINTGRAKYLEAMASAKTALLELRARVQLQKHTPTPHSRWRQIFHR